MAWGYDDDGRPIPWPSALDSYSAYRDQVLVKSFEEFVQYNPEVNPEWTTLPDTYFTSDKGIHPTFPDTMIWDPLLNCWKMPASVAPYSFAWINVRNDQLMRGNITALRIYYTSVPNKQIEVELYNATGGIQKYKSGQLIMLPTAFSLEENRPFFEYLTFTFTSGVDYTFKILRIEAYMTDFPVSKYQFIGEAAHQYNLGGVYIYDNGDFFFYRGSEGLHYSIANKAWTTLLNISPNYFQGVSLYSKLLKNPCFFAYSSSYNNYHYIKTSIGWYEEYIGYFQYGNLYTPYQVLRENGELFVPIKFNKSVSVAKRTSNGTWTAEQATSENSMGSQFHMTVDSSGYVHIVTGAYTAPYYYIKHTTNKTGSWVTSIVKTLPSGSSWSNLEGLYILCDGETPHIFSLYSGLVIFSWNGSSWVEKYIFPAQTGYIYGAGRDTVKNIVSISIQLIEYDFSIPNFTLLKTTKNDTVGGIGGFYRLENVIGIYDQIESGYNHLLYRRLF
jgi:hypothetical protein